MTCRTGKGWSAPAFVNISGGSFGLQLGAESSDLVLFFMNDRGARSLVKGSGITLGGEASVAAGPFGRTGGADGEPSSSSPRSTRTPAPRDLFAEALDRRRPPRDQLGRHRELLRSWRSRTSSCCLEAGRRRCRRRQEAFPGRSLLRGSRAPASSCRKDVVVK